MPAEPATQGRTDETRYLVVSSDSHAGPSLDGDLRPYCPAKYRSEFQAYIDELEWLRTGDDIDQSALRDDQRFFWKFFRDASGTSTGRSPGWVEAARRQTECPGQADPHARIRDMNADGIAAAVIFAGGNNGQFLPFLGAGFNAGPAAVAAELRAVGGHMWNGWLADYVSVEPHRHVGVMQIPIWDVDAAIEEVQWGAQAGLKAINLPAPRRDFPSYNDPIYEPFWAACEEVGLPFVTHTAGGERPLGADGICGSAMQFAETHWLARRGLWQLILSGVFERYPRLKIVFTEQRVDWVPHTLEHLDSIYFDDVMEDVRERLSKPPSEYWFSNCYNSGSFLAPFEARLLRKVGEKNLMWGSDYPHAEGTWPRTQLCMRHTFAGVPHDDVRQILGENALGVFPLDGEALRQIAAEIGPMPADLDEPLAPDEYPEFRGHAFRERGSFS